MIYRIINQFKVKRIMEKRSIVLKYGLIVLLFIVAIISIFHCGIMGIIPFSMLYGLLVITSEE